jgi:hypothetical protein
MKKILFILGCVILFSACTTQKSTVISSPTPVVSPIPFPSPVEQIDTSNWKTYSNKNWSLKYPADWTVVDCGEPSIIILGPAPTKGQKVACMSEYPHPNEVMRIERRAKDKEGIPYSTSDVLKTERVEIKVGNKTGVSQTLVYPDGDKSYDHVYVENPDSLDAFHVAGKEKYQNVFETILSTVEIK